MSRAGAEVRVGRDQRAQCLPRFGIEVQGELRAGEAEHQLGIGCMQLTQAGALQLRRLLRIAAVEAFLRQPAAIVESVGYVELACGFALAAFGVGTIVRAAAVAHFGQHFHDEIGRDADVGTDQQNEQLVRRPASADRMHGAADRQGRGQNEQWMHRLPRPACRWRVIDAV